MDTAPPTAPSRPPTEKALSQPAAEYRFDGLAEIAVGGALATIAVATEQPARALLLIAGFALILGSFFYLLFTRRMLSRAVGAATRLNDAEIEDSKTMKLRVLRRTGLQVAGLGLLVLFSILRGGPTLAFGSGAMLGGGGAMFAAALWLRRWEDEHEARLLRYPAYRWRRERGSGWDAGGIMDARDFFVVASRKAALAQKTST